jgi:hypothetical protein
MHHPNMTAIVVLNDGETFTDAEGCTVRFVPDEVIGHDRGEDVDALVRADELELQPVICWSDVIDMAATLLEPTEIDLNPEYFRALAELCNRLSGRTSHEIETTEAELRKAAQTL